MTIQSILHYRMKKLLNKSYIQGTKGNYFKSIKFAQKVIKLNPRSSEAHRLIGNAYKLLGDEAEIIGSSINSIDYHRKATIFWDKAKSINPDIIIPGYHK